MVTSKEGTSLLFSLYSTDAVDVSMSITLARMLVLIVELRSSSILKLISVLEVGTVSRSPSVTSVLAPINDSFIMRPTFILGNNVERMVESSVVTDVWVELSAGSNVTVKVGEMSSSSISSSVTDETVVSEVVGNESSVDPDSEVERTVVVAVGSVVSSILETAEGAVSFFILSSIETAMLVSSPNIKYV